jgi:hypothetical protein
MTKNNPVSTTACAPGALSGGPTRTRFFDGMFLTQADLENEQRFWRLKRRLTNRALGQGVVWGLRLGYDHQRGTFTLSPGYAIDCCGNDLIVERAVEIGEAELWPHTYVPRNDDRKDVKLERAVREDPGFVFEAEGKKRRQICIALQYTECADEPRSVHRDACAGPTGACEPSRVRETVRIVAVPPPARRLTPPEIFVKELNDLIKSLPKAQRDELFPPQEVMVTPPGDAVPMTVRVALPDSDATLDQRPANSESLSVQPTLTSKLSGDQKTAVVNFELRPDKGWGLSSCSVKAQSKVVSQVSGAPAPTTRWSLELPVSELSSDTGSQFDYAVDDVTLTQLFGTSDERVGSLRVRGRVKLTKGNDGTQLASVEDVRVQGDFYYRKRKRPQDGCLSGLLPFIESDFHTSRDVAGVLVLAAVYAVLSEVAHKYPNTGAENTLYDVYTSLWKIIFNVYIGPYNRQLSKQLSCLILELYRRWCDGFAYPGPHCNDQHHGVYLGCAEVDGGGNVTAFEMWEHRRYVVTGALLGHWSEQLGFASLDVLVGRFAQAMCCLGSFPPYEPPYKYLEPAAATVASQRIHVGTPGTVSDFATTNDAQLRWTSLSEIAQRAVSSFLSRDEGRLEVLAATVPGGGTVGILVSRKEAGKPVSKQYASVRDDITSQLKRGKLRVAERGRQPVADFVISMLEQDSTMDALLVGAPAETVQVATEFRKGGGKAIDLLAGGSAEVLASLADRSDATLTGTDDLVARAESTLDTLLSSTVQVMGSTVDRTTFAQAEVRKKLSVELSKSALPKIGEEVVMSAADKAATE